MVHRFRLHFFFFFLTEIAKCYIIQSEAKPLILYIGGINHGFFNHDVLAGYHLSSSEACKAHQKAAQAWRRRR